MSFQRALYFIIEKALKCIVSALGSMCLIADGGILFSYVEPRGMILCDVSRMKAKQ